MSTSGPQYDVVNTNSSSARSNTADSISEPSKTYTPQALTINSRLQGRKILFVGGGNLSYELAFAQKHPNLACEMVATTYEPLDEFEENSLSVDNKLKLLDLGVKVYHKIDATLLHKLGFFKQMDPKQIYFSHPHSGNPDLPTSELLEKFFYSVANSKASKDCTIHIIRVRGGEYELSKPADERKFHFSKAGYDLIEHYKNLYGFHDICFFDFELTAKHRFNERRYPGYKHVKTNDDSNSAPIIKGNNSLEYVFSRNDSDDDWSDSDCEYDSECIDSDSDSDAESIVANKKSSSCKI